MLAIGDCSFTRFSFSFLFLVFFFVSYYFHLNFISFFYFCLPWIFIAAWATLWLCCMGFSLVVLHGLPFTVASLVVGHEL